MVRDTANLIIVVPEIKPVGQLFFAGDNIFNFFIHLIRFMTGNYQDVRYAKR